MQPRGKYIQWTDEESETYRNGGGFPDRGFHEEVVPADKILTVEEFKVCLEYNIKVWNPTAWQHVLIEKFKKSPRCKPDFWAREPFFGYLLTKEARKALKDIGYHFKKKGRNITVFLLNNRQNVVNCSHYYG